MIYKHSLSLICFIWEKCLLILIYWFYQNEAEERAKWEDNYIGGSLNLWSKYVQAEDSMLLGRTCLMVDYQACNRALDKAKPNRKELVSTPMIFTIV